MASVVAEPGKSAQALNTLPIAAKAPSLKTFAH
jgi:hypothetical protein